MKNTITPLDIITYYENLDTTDFPIVEPDVIKKIRERKAEFLENQKMVFGFEQEVAYWLSQQNHDTKQLINGFVKNFMQTQSQFSHNFG